jgi:hypothetical protein
MDIDTLADKIDATRIQYEERSHWMSISGSPFVCEFEDSVSPEHVCDVVATSAEPWRLFGWESKLADAQTDDDGEVVESSYWKVIGTLFSGAADDEFGVTVQFADSVDDT